MDLSDGNADLVVANATLSLSSVVSIFEESGFL